MANTPGRLDRKISSVAGPPVGGTRSGPGPQSPHTPQRGAHSTISSPGSGYRTEDDFIVLQIGSRGVLAGFAGDSKPCCALSFGEAEADRVGDYRRWLPGYGDTSKPKYSVADWGADHELWQMDMRGMDLTLLEDKLERALRVAYSKHLLLDPKSRKVLLALPSVLPHPIIGTILSTLFNFFQVPSVMILSQPLLAVLGAGQRSGLVVDIGWHETTVTCVHEFREICQTRTNRALRRTTIEMGKILGSLFRPVDDQAETRSSDHDTSDGKMQLDFAYVEDITRRLAWCPCEKSQEEYQPNTDAKSDVSEATVTQGRIETPSQDRFIELSASNMRSTQTNVSTFKEPVESVLLLHPEAQRDQDDEELSIPFLLYNTLLSQSSDIRASCLPNIAFIGGGSKIPGLKSRILAELSLFIKDRGWNPVWPQPQSNRDHVDGVANKLKQRPIAKYLDKDVIESSRNEHGSSDANIPDQPPNDTGLSKDSGAQEVVETIQETQEQEDQNVMETAQETQEQSSREGPRSIATVGIWSGASLAAGLRLRATVEIEREIFLQTGLAGARATKEVDHASLARNRQSLGPNPTRSSATDLPQWTLGVWA